MTALLFGCYAAFVFLLIGGIANRWLRWNSRRVLLSLFVWLVYVGVLSLTGVMGDTSLRPPGMAFVLVPVAALVLYLATSAAGIRIALAIPLWVLLGAQAFRIGVELLIHRLWTDGLAPRLMTFEGGNLDLYVGISAPLIAWIASKGRGGLRAALLWNFVGLAALANILIRALGTSPGVLNFISSEVPDVALGRFPFTYLAGFLAPLALILHVLAIRALRRQLSDRALDPVNGRAFAAQID